MNSSTILYKDSPFLPAIDNDSKHRVIVDIFANMLPPVVAIAKEAGTIGTDHNKKLEEELDWLYDAFESDVRNIDNFMFGFTIPPTLIIGGYVAGRYGLPTAIKAICPPTKDETKIRLNNFKSYHLAHAHNIIQSTLNRQPLIGATPIYELCELEVFADDSFYLAGVEASKIVFTGLSDCLHLF